MDIPKLNRSSRSREYNKYEQVIIDIIVYDYLFKGLSHRKLDEKYTHMDSVYSRGYQSMGILHYLGLRNEFKGIFKDKNVVDVISILENETDEYEDVVKILKRISDLEAESAQEKILAEKAKKYEYTTNMEGKKIVYYSNRYERSSKNRKLAIALHGSKCMVCGFDFEEKYGDWGKNYIEVHHNKPLADLDEEVEICPATDLSTVCSNCHRMIHKKRDKTLSIDELKEIIKRSL